jgi:hypothetical protein
MTVREAVSYVAREHPEWMDRVAACCKAQQAKEPGVAISAWDVAHALGQPTRPLGPLVTWGILDHAGDATRRGHRRYYFVRAGVCEALREVRL